MNETPTKKYEIIGTKEEAPGTVTLCIRSKSGKPDFRAGQYITVYFPELGVPEGKAYSLSSAPEEPSLSITVKAMGQFSNRLCSMRTGETFLGSDPYGFFFSEEKKTPLVMLASGIGITPFRALIRAYLTEDPRRDILLCYGNRTESDIMFREAWKILESTHPSFHTVHFISRQDTMPSHFEKGRMSAERVLPLVHEPERSEFMLCGSISFVRDLWRGLRAAGIAEEKIYTEAFFTN